MCPTKDVTTPNRHEGARHPTDSFDCTDRNMRQKLRALVPTGYQQDQPELEVQFLAPRLELLTLSPISKMLCVLEPAMSRTLSLVLVFFLAWTCGPRPVQSTLVAYYSFDGIDT